MSGDFEYRDDPKMAESSVGCPREVCAVKFETLMKCAAFVRRTATGGHNPVARDAARLVDLLDHVGLVPGFEASPIREMLDAGMFANLPTP